MDGNGEKRGKSDGGLRDKKGSRETERGVEVRDTLVRREREMWEDCVNNRHINEAI